jgi:hypothetical protein
MLQRMVRSRLIAAALLGFGVALSVACTAKQQNGQDCLRSEDCESGQCTQYVCVDPNASRPVLDSGTSADAAEGGPSDTAPVETGPSDTGAADSGGADSGGGDSGAADVGGD